MKTLARWALAIILNVILLVAAQALIPGFILTGTWLNWLELAFILAILNFLVKPILKFFLAPVIILTLGLGLVAINMLILFLLDFLSRNLTIQGIPALFFAALLFGIINFIFHLVTK